MADEMRGNITARRLKERQDYAAARARQRELNAEAEQNGAGGVVIRDGRPGQRELLKSAPGAPENKALAGPGENKNALSGVDFASTAAKDEAVRAGLTAKDFRGKKPSGASGFTAADVREIRG